MKSCIKICLLILLGIITFACIMHSVCSYYTNKITKSYINIQNKENINIAYTIDNNYVVPLLLSVNSILKNNPSKSNYNFYIIYDKLSIYNRYRIKHFITKNKQNIHFYKVDTSKIDDGKNIYNNLAVRITRIAIARILITDILPEDIHKIIYLDADTLINMDIKKLWDINLNGKSAGMVLDILLTSQNKKYASTISNTYCNSGVILIDLDKWRKNDISKKSVNFIKKNKKKFFYSSKNNLNAQYYIFADQDLLNIILKNDIKLLPSKYNNQVIENKSMTDTFKPSILHYIGVIKPWDFVFDTSIYSQRIYFDYWKNSDLKYYYYLSYANAKYVKGINKYLIKKFDKLKLKIYIKFCVEPYMT